MSRHLTETDAVRYLQTYLRAQRLADPTFPAVPVDGIFDSQTKLALTEFQRRNGLDPSGVADRTTWDLLYTQYLEILNDISLPEPIIPFPSYPTDYSVGIGDKSFLVAIIQYMIVEISIVYNTLEPTEITGLFDEKTKNAIYDFQEKSGLAASGRVDRATWGALSRIFNLSTHYIDQI